MSKRTLRLAPLLLCLGLNACFLYPANAQTQPSSLQDCIDFALRHQGRLQQARIDEEIGEREIAATLSAWYPQLSASGSYNRNIVIPTTVMGDQVVRMGQPHTSAWVFQAEQQLLNAGLIHAAKAATHIRERNSQATQLAEVNTVVAVSKAFYDILTSHEQILIIRENINRIQKQGQDANARYETGIVDKTDYKRAQISLSNGRADLKRAEELLGYKYAYLKELMGLDIDTPLELSFDKTSMEQEILLDTTSKVVLENRIEYRQLLTAKQLQQINTQSSKLAFLPNLSASYNYGWDFRNGQFQGLYSNNFPRSVFGLSLQFPIFQGTRRIQEMRKSQLQEKRIDWDLMLIGNSIRTEYELALASYKANLNDWKTARENVSLAEEVYQVIQLQYNEGIKTYLDLMMAETDLRASQVNYLNALYAVLAGKLDASRALGNISINR